MERGKPFRGVFVIVVTPFDEKGRLDEESLRAVVDFCIEAGVHGLVTPANASELIAATRTRSSASSLSRRTNACRSSSASPLAPSGRPSKWHGTPRTSAPTA